MLAVYSTLLALTVFAHLSGYLAAVAMPAIRVEDGAAEQDGLASLLAEEPLGEPAGVSADLRRNLMLDAIRESDEGPKVVIVSDMRLKGHGVRGLNPGFTRGLPLIADRSLRGPPAEYSLKIDRRNTDLDIMRCMIGRVYRPCWEE